MSTLVRSSVYTINLKNVTHAQDVGDATLLYPSDSFVIRVPGEEGSQVVAQLKAVGFIGDDYLLINPDRFVMAQNNGATVVLILDGASKAVIAPVEFLAHLEPDPAPSVSVAGTVSTAGNSGMAVPAKKKKSAE